MNRFICRLFGHRWDHRVTFAFGTQLEQCGRCHEIRDSA
ncbi:DUF1660 family phage protein [Glaciihabitans sp. UYNi722]